MTRVLLIQPSIRHSSLSKIINLYCEEPLGLEYIASSLLKEGHEVRIIDTHILRLTEKKLKHIIEKENPDIVGISCTTPSFHQVKNLSKIIKTSNKECLIVCGGPHTSALPLETLKEIKELDICVIGEGEKTMVEIANGKSWEKIRGIAFRKGSKITLNEGTNVIKNLDELPFPARFLTPYEEYKTLYMRPPTLTIISSRGCPFRCTFCSRIIRGIRFRSIENIIEEWKELVHRYRAGSIFVADDLFTFKKDRVIEICRSLIKEGLSVPWFCQSRVDTVDKEMLKMMAKAGCERIIFGIESFSQRSLNEMKKGISLHQIKKALKITKEMGISTYGTFLIGLPNETISDINKTLKFIKEEKTLDFATFHILQPFPGSKIFEISKKDGMIKSYDWSKFGFGIHEECLIKTKNISEKELKYLKKKLQFSFYCDPERSPFLMFNFFKWVTRCFLHKLL